ncbi:hypothetical protein ACFV0T_09975 [Streptomyces sp. NPDC059582]|uniref:hypothetical protein n=1 Tax=Streptomyces sp. NPDC059582 TaxID=3346875 RepID=UPI0036911CD3
MRHPGPALRVALLGIAVTVVGYALFAAWLAGHAHAYESARDRATATATGLIVEDGIGDDADIRVRWTDAVGHTRVQRFGVYDTERYAEGRHFRVAYDPVRADPRGFPADPDETVAEEDLEVPVVLGAIAVVPLCGIWVWRGVRFRWASRWQGRPMTAAVHCGRRTGSLWRSAETTWLALTPADGPERPDHPELSKLPERWQRVMWHPALADLADGPVPVTVHARGKRPAVVRLPDGTRLVPLGRSRRKLPSGFDIGDHAVRADLRNTFVLPVGAVLRPARPWWREGAVIAGLGAVFGVVLGFTAGGGTLVAVVGFVLCLPPLFFSSWALSAPQP